jgi:hypothetical protein
MPLVAGGRTYYSADSAAYNNFIGRALTDQPTLNTTHQNAYRVMLNGLTMDGLFNADV